jgi:hypothetical protein
MFFLGIGLFALFIFVAKAAWGIIKDLLKVVVVLMLILSIFKHAVIIPTLMLIGVMILIDILLEFLM